ncbi:hypothetical protein MXAN_2190 [Myxococcus xanthus DK 1622]|uniref:Uncharacterized protein n=1 Tax=Myxococcus xanthus (strain DK1622) TaxID=246197 RepID=Q1DAB0_MYXXD|nr:hypothetical protein MXAN_2190 [Myxococcus xanthus DK 1622]
MRCGPHHVDGFPPPDPQCPDAGGRSHTTWSLQECMARTVEMSLLEALGEPQPEPLKPRDFILP